MKKVILFGKILFLIFFFAGALACYFSIGNNLLHVIVGAFISGAGLMSFIIIFVFERLIKFVDKNYILKP